MVCGRKADGASMPAVMYLEPFAGGAGWIGGTCQRAARRSHRAAA